MQTGAIGIFETQVRFQAISEVLSISTHAADVLSTPVENSVQAAVPNSASDSAGGPPAFSDSIMLWAVVAGRALSYLGQLLGQLLHTTAAPVMAARVILMGLQTGESRVLDLQQLQHSG